MHKKKHAPCPIDVTYKGARGLFIQLAPRKSWVMKIKDGSMTEEEYTILYRADILHNANWSELIEWLEEEKHITFICYCSDGNFCHTNLLIDYMIEHFPKYFKRAKSKIRNLI